MTDFLRVLSQRQDQLLQSIFEHLWISLVSLSIATMIAIPLAIVLLKKEKIAEGVLQLTGILQTIPSLALLGLLIPLVGIGPLPAVIALVIYGLLPIFQNTYTGFSQIDPSLLEASSAFGMTRTQKLLKVQLPLALPMMIAGVRISLVMIIGTATLAALIGAGGLGTFILLGIDRNNPSLILIGALSAALLAILFSFAIKRIEKMSFRKMLISLLVFVLLLGVAMGISASYRFMKQETTVTIGGKLGSEPDVLINMYKLLIEQDSPEVKVILKPNMGKTSFLFNALKGGQIQIYPEFTGTVLQTFVQTDREPGNDPAAVYEEGKRLLLQEHDMEFLSPMAYQNTYAIAVKKEFAKEHHLETISDLANYPKTLRAGFTLEFMDRSDGYPGLQKLYGLKVQGKSMEPKLRYLAIDNGEVEVVDAYSTDSELQEYGLKILKDDKQLFPPYQGAPLMMREFAEKNPHIVKSLNKLSGKITEEEMIYMNYLVNVEEREPSQVARDFLKEKGLLDK